MSLVRYTLQEVVATLAMIEQPTTTFITESKMQSPEQSDEADYPLEKTPMLDEEVVVIKEQAITTSIRKTIRHLHNIGGFASRWRGFRISIFYHMVHGLFANLMINYVFGRQSVPLHPLAYLISSVLLARIHMTWTHIMISNPSDKSWFRRIPSGRFIFRTLALPSLVFALAQQAVVVVPAMVFASFGPTSEKFAEDETLRVCATLAAGIFTAILVLLPASVTLTRIEASLLPEDQETIVSFDRTLNGAAVSAIGFDLRGTKTVFVEAWRSFEKPARLRLVKLYLKAFFIQAAIVAVGLMVIVGEVYLIGPEKLKNFVLAGVAQIELMMMNNGQN